MHWLPETRLGKWSIWLNVFFLLTIIISITLVNILGILSYDNTWWDITVNVFILPIISFILGIKAIKKKDGSVLVYASIVLGFITILFILLHSLFISD